jgi:8-oxo-dGTP pyrophosphatase MutT (NUDIX family)
MAGVNRKAYQKRLPRKRISAGCLLFDEVGRLLIVNPTYKDGWEIPGGTVEANESPLAGCIREIREELGLDLRPLRLLVVDYNPETAERTESLNFIFDGGVLTDEQRNAIVVPPREIGEFRFMDPRNAVQMLKRRLRRRVTTALQQRAAGTMAYLEEQVETFEPESRP